MQLLLQDVFSNTAKRVWTAAEIAITTRNMDRDLSTPAFRLKFAREKAGYQTATAFWHKNNINQSVYSGHETGGRGIKPQAAAIYANALKNCSAAWILYGEGDGPIELPDHDYDQAPNITVPEIDIQASAGDGSLDQALDVNGNHMVVATWQMPAAYLKSVVASADAIRIIQVVGDSMEPDFFSGERVMVDTAHHLPTPPAVYVLFDGIGLFLKQLELIPRSDPPRVRVTSRNPNYPTYEADLSDIHINGRVMGKWTWK